MAHDFSLTDNLTPPGALPRRCSDSGRDGTVLLTLPSYCPINLSEDYPDGGGAASAIDGSEGVKPLRSKFWNPDVQ